MKRKIISRISRALGQPSGAVLLYHRVRDVVTDPQLLAVSPRNFADHLQVVKETSWPVRLQDLVSAAPSASRSRRVAFTFDDGYADNLHHALPLLRAEAVPATVFVVAGQVGRPEEFWWDDLERVLLGSQVLPDRLDIEIGQQAYTWQIPPGEVADARWNVLSDQSRTPRQTAYVELCTLLRPLDEPTRQTLLARLRAWAAVTETGRVENRALSEHEVTTLASDGLVEVGAHSVTHSVLSRQPASVQRGEIETSKSRLEDLVSEPVGAFSYPFGGRRDYTKSTVRFVKDAGYDRACSNFPGTIHGRTDPYQIPRILVRDWTGDEFARRLNAIFNG